MASMEKPVCGGGEEVGEYDVGLHVAGLCEQLPNSLTFRLG